MQYIEIKIPKGVLYLTMKELFELPPEILTTGLKRGKAFKRTEQAQKRNIKM